METRDSIVAGVSMVVITLLLVVTTILLVKYNVYVNTWYKVYVLQRFQSNTGNSFAYAYRSIARNRRFCKNENLCKGT